MGARGMGGYFGGYIKPANFKDNRRDRRLVRNQNGKRKVVVIVRERAGTTWREENRRDANDEQMNRLAGLAMMRKPSVDFGGYWQRRVEPAN